MTWRLVISFLPLLGLTLMFSMLWEPHKSPWLHPALALIWALNAAVTSWPLRLAWQLRRSQISDLDRVWGEE